MTDRLLQLRLKIAYVYAYLPKEVYTADQEIFQINQLKLITTTPVIDDKCGIVAQNHILSVQVQATVQFLVQ